MDRPAALLARLEAIGEALKRSGQALALIGLGSAGSERTRLDEFSDLDFFVVARASQKAALLADLGWLAAVCPIAYAFLNTADGYKLLFEDGIFCEMAVFEPAELEHTAFTAGQIIWHAAGVDPAIAVSRFAPPSPVPHDLEWLIGEALTNLYVGLCRHHRGEKLSALRFVQVYAVDRILELAAYLEAEQPAFVDPFGRERRFEEHYPLTALALPRFMPGYEGTPLAARAILDFLAARFPVNPAMQAAILGLCER